MSMLTISVLWRVRLHSDKDQISTVDKRKYFFCSKGHGSYDPETA